jgi:hypothetical protein
MSKANDATAAVGQGACTDLEPTYKAGYFDGINAKLVNLTTRPPLLCGFEFYAHAQNLFKLNPRSLPPVVTCSSISEVAPHDARVLRRDVVLVDFI